MSKRRNFRQRKIDIERKLPIIFNAIVDDVDVDFEEELQFVLVEDQGGNGAARTAARGSGAMAPIRKLDHGLSTNTSVTELPPEGMVINIPTPTVKIVENRQRIVEAQQKDMGDVMSSAATDVDVRSHKMQRKRENGSTCAVAENAIESQNGLIVDDSNGGLSNGFNGDRHSSNSSHISGSGNLDVTNGNASANARGNDDQKLVINGHEIGGVKVKDSKQLTRRDFTQPRHYIRYTGLSYDEEKEYVYYDLDDRDFEWLESNKDIDENTLELVIDRLERETGFKSRLASLADVSNEMKRKQIPDALLQRMYDYWHKRRLSRVSKKEDRYRAGKPLLYDFEKPPDSNTQDPLVPFRPRERDRFRKNRLSERDAFHRMRQLREDMEKLRMLTELVLKRERFKRQHLNLMHRMTRTQLDVIRLNPQARENGFLHAELMQDNYGYSIGSVMPEPSALLHRGSHKKRESTSSRATTVHAHSAGTIAPADVVRQRINQGRTQRADTHQPRHHHHLAAAQESIYPYPQAQYPQQQSHQLLPHQVHRRRKRQASSEDSDAESDSDRAQVMDYVPLHRLPSSVSDPSQFYQMNLLDVFERFSKSQTPLFPFLAGLRNNKPFNSFSDSSATNGHIASNTVNADGTVGSNVPERNRDINKFIKNRRMSCRFGRGGRIVFSSRPCGLRSNSSGDASSSSDDGDDSDDSDDEESDNGNRDDIGKYALNLRLPSWRKEQCFANGSRFGFEKPPPSGGEGGI